MFCVQYTLGTYMAKVRSWNKVKWHRSPEEEDILGTRTSDYIIAHQHY